jgi:catechol 2,3-dioxygenase-like lactoylglutathione lyase family enzyme
MPSCEPPSRATIERRAAEAIIRRVEAPRLDHVVIKVSDWERSNAFYRDVVGAELVELPRGRAAYRLGNAQINVHGPGSNPGVLPVKPVEPGNSDLCLEWAGPIEDAVARLQRHGVPIVDGPIERQGVRGTGRSVYFNDPDGSLLEFISYE